MAKVILYTYLLNLKYLLTGLIDFLLSIKDLCLHRLWASVRSVTYSLLTLTFVR